jgi:GNAT superfamily N-acetyltransferase
MTGKDRLLRALRRRGFDYACFKVYSMGLGDPHVDRLDALPDGYRFDEITSEDLLASPFQTLRDCAWYGGADSFLYALRRSDGVITCLQCIWSGDRFRQQGFWPLGDQEAVSVHLVTPDEERGKGLATYLKQQSARRMRDRGFTRLYSRIWWTNTASLRVSEKVHWSHLATIVELMLPGRARPVRFVMRNRRSQMLSGLRLQRSRSTRA